MTERKERRLAVITDEVKQFHPLLDKLLRRLPTVKRVEYTHGADEMGADFVVERDDEVFHHTQYVGVIAKVGRVVQDFTGIERQIAECLVARGFLGGKEKIRLDEVWVILTEHITRGAKEKIAEKYRSTKLIFIPGEELEGLVDRYVPAFWTAIPLETGDYLTQLRDSTVARDQALSLLPAAARDFYVEQEIFEFPGLEYELTPGGLRRKPVPVDIASLLTSTGLVLIEGGAGAGKSKLLRHLIQRSTTQEAFLAEKALPILCGLKEFVDEHSSSLAALIQKRVPILVIAEAQYNRYLVLLDGLDEKNMPLKDQLLLLGKLRSEAEARSDITVVLTSRYLDGLDRSSGGLSAYRRLELRPLSFRKTLEFLTHICDKLNLTHRVLEDLKKSSLFRELPHSPIAAILLARLINENAKDLPANMPELYAKYLELMLGRWDIDKGLQSQKEYQALESVLIELARYMLDNELQFVSLEEATNFFQSYLRKRNLKLDASALFDKAIKRAEVLGIDGDTSAVFFRHRTFAEFFYAKGLARKDVIARPDRAFTFYWLNTIYFFLGLRKDCPDELRSIIASLPASEPERWLKIVNLANHLMAAYTTPYDVVEEGVSTAMLEAATLYRDVTESRTTSIFGGFAPMQLLYLLQWLIRDGYGYEFFTEAFEVAALEIDDSKADDLTKAYALFFLSVSALAAGKDTAFDFLLDKHVGRLPLDVALALRHETPKAGRRTALVRKQDRYIQRVLKGNREMKQAVENLYERPIRLKPTLKGLKGKESGPTSKGRK